METIASTSRTKLKLHPERGSFERAFIDAVLDEGLVCHLGFTADGQPFVIPTTYARVGEQVYLHGAAAGRMLKALQKGAPVCFTVTLLDGLVLAKSALRHSMNYRSVVAMGTAVEVTDVEEKRRALAAIVEHVAPGRMAEVRAPSPEEIRATLVFSLPLTEVSGKRRSGPPVDLPQDEGVPCWAGVIPLRLRVTTDVDPRLWVNERSCYAVAQRLQGHRQP